MVAGLALLIFSTAAAHEGHHHAPAEEQSLSPPSPILLEKTNSAYLRQVQPIFRQKCFDCHSTQTRFPWYYRLPIAKQLIDDDIHEAREHVEMSRGFPFGGHHPLEEQFESLKEVIQKGKMPLWRYRLFHPGSGLTPSEKETVLRWIKESQEELLVK